jgi:hypothetical protein
MKERRSLVEGIKPNVELDRLETEFVFGANRKPEAVETLEALPPKKEDVVSDVVIEKAPPPFIDRSVLPQIVGRVPVTARCRPEIASALKRASLQRQLAGAEPHYVQDIMEQALEAWLREKGYVE